METVIINGIEYVRKVAVEEKKEFDYTTIKTIEDARSELNYRIDYCAKRLLESDDEWAYRMIKMVVLAVNNEWTPNWKDNAQKKWFPWFNLDKEAGLVFVYSTYGASSTSPTIGSRLCLADKEKAEFVGKQFIDLYEMFLL